MHDQLSIPVHLVADALEANADAAADAIPTDGDPAVAATRLAAALGLMLLIAVVRRFGPQVVRRLPKPALPWVVAAVGGAVALALRHLGVELPGMQSDLGAALEGVLGGMAAGGAWSMTRVVRRRPGAEGAPQAAPAAETTGPADAKTS